MTDSGAAAIFWTRLGLGLVLIGGLWIAFYAADRALPFIEPGHELIYDLAEHTIHEGNVFPSNDGLTRFAAFGDSRMLAGFKPDLFDRLSSGGVHSFNLGLPDNRRFMKELRTLLERSQTPNVVALTNSWAEAPEPEGWERLSDDAYLMELFFPFRSFFRDLTLFTLRSLSRGGPVAYYDLAKNHVDQARRDRGYFFIEGMSHYPNHRLPDDFHTPRDDASQPEPRDPKFESPLFDDLLELQKKGGFRTVFIPSYFRVGSRAPAPANAETKARLESFGIEVHGPDYWLYPNRLFSDPAHLNREGAELYTRDLWDLLAPILGGGASATAPPS